MSYFLEEQKVKKRGTTIKVVRVVERFFFSVAVIFGGLAALYGLYLLVIFGPVFSVRDIVVEGEPLHIAYEEILEIAELREGENLFRADVAGAHERLKAHPWVKEATVRRRLPGTIWIYLSEYVPVAVVINGNEAYFADRQGVLFKKVEEGDPKGYQVITGVKNFDRSALSDDSIMVAMGLMNLYIASPLGSFWGASELHRYDSLGFSVFTEKGPFEIFLGNDQFESKLAFLSKCRENPGIRTENVRYILANSDKKITVGYGEKL